MAWPQAADNADPLFDAVNVRFEFGRISLVTGPTGSGKSTLLHLLAGLLRPVSGVVSDQGKPISRWPTSHRDHWRRQVGICFQSLHLISGLSVVENVLQPMIPRNMGWSAMVDRAQEMLSALDLAAFMKMPVQILSGGQQQRVAVARAMVHAPRILLADEPTAFQDDDHTRLLMDLFDRCACRGACVVVSSHDTRLRQSTRFHARYGLNDGNLEAVI
jgi:putative ABC transport system ATP-binding protein